MPKSLLVVESPTKARTLKKYLGNKFTIKASVGHIKNLPKNKLGVNIEKDFEPEYVTIRGKGPLLKELRDAAKKADKIYLAPDPDREGEAIAWHISHELKNVDEEKIYRVLINEFTPRSITEAIKNPIRIDKNRVYAQQARRVLDRLVGYKISPILWKKVIRGLSAGRVQSVALRLVCEREKEINAFVSEEYWSIVANLKGNEPPEFEARLNKIDDKKAEVKDSGQADTILSDLKNETFVVDDIEKKKRKKWPVPPFITSTLQQEASRKLGFSVRKTMMIAQQLYEGIDLGAGGTVGLITYMRTDSNRIAPEAQKEARSHITKAFGKEFIPEKPPVYKSKKSAQEAHEAIRPSLPLRSPEEVKSFLSKDQYSLYLLIWNRFLASQMAPALVDLTRVSIKAGKYLFLASGSVIVFKGFTRVYEETRDDNNKKNNGSGDEDMLLPELKKEEKLSVTEIVPRQHFTQPPPRFTEASLVKELEDKGIGRPSTYATILNSIRSRGYVTEEKRRLHPTELGMTVLELLVTNFSKEMDVAFTADMEEKLDKVEKGVKGWTETLKEFYGPFSKSLEQAEKNMKDLKKEVEKTDILCEECEKKGLDSKMVIKWGRFGKFYACERFPECRNTKQINGKNEPEETPEQLSDEKCEKCGAVMVIKEGRFGKYLLCKECKKTKSIIVSTDIPCTEEGCDGEFIEKRTKRGKVFYGCSKYPQCKNAIWQKPVPANCPDCGHPYLVEKWDRKLKKNFIACPQKGCKYKKGEEEKG